MNLRCYPVGRYSKTFEAALVAARYCLDEYPSHPKIGVFFEAVGDGLSYEFTKALGDFCDGSESAVTTIRQEPDGAKLRPLEIAFGPPDSSVLGRAASALAMDPELQDVGLIGEVTFLSREVGDPDRVIRLTVDEGAAVKKARVRLSDEQYDLAMEANRAELRLFVSGRMEREGNLFWIYEPERVEILPDDDGYGSGSGSTRSSSRGDQETLNFDDI